VPASESDVLEYFRQVQPELACTPRSRLVLGLLAEVRLPVPAARLSRDVFLLAGNALLPGWATDMLERSPRQRRQARFAGQALWSIAPVFRAALRDGIANRACRRLGIPPERLQHWFDTVL
jgi:uncharacterized protein (DUF2236 family)